MPKYIHFYLFNFVLVIISSRFSIYRKRLSKMKNKLYVCEMHEEIYFKNISNILKYILSIKNVDSQNRREKGREGEREGEKEGEKRGRQKRKQTDMYIFTN